MFTSKVFANINLLDFLQLTEIYKFWTEIIYCNLVKFFLNKIRVLKFHIGGSRASSGEGDYLSWSRPIGFGLDKHNLNQTIGVA